MKITTILSAFVLFTLWTVSMGSVRNPNNPPTGVTGAPGENTCGESGCHGGGSYTGTVAISGVPDTVIANQTYSITLKQTSNAVRGGFELTALDSLKVKAGTLTAGTGCSIATSGSRQYERQSTPKNLSGGSVSWTFAWKAPATVTGTSKKIIFYFVSLMANGNGGTSGDKVASANKTVILMTPTPVSEVDLAGQLKIYPVPAHDVMHIDIPEAANARLTVFGADGKLAVQMTLQANNQLDVSNFKKGLYFAKIEMNGQSVTKTFVVQ